MMANTVEDPNHDPNLYSEIDVSSCTLLTNIELLTPTSKRELIKTINIIGQENTTIKNQPFIEIYDDGSVEKKYVIE